MNAGDAYVGQAVTYWPEHGTHREDGVVTEVREAGMVMVRYDGDQHAKSTHCRDLTPAQS